MPAGAATLSRVPNSDLSMALVAGRVVSVIELAGSSGALLVCEHEGEPVAFSGLVIEQVGLFEVSASGARVGEALLPELSLSEELRRALGHDAELDDVNEPD